MQHVSGAVRLNQRVIGAIACLAFLAIGIGVASPLLPDSSTIGVLARIFGSLAPLFLVAGACLGLVLIPLRAGRMGLFFIAASALSLGLFAARHVMVSQPLDPAAAPDLRVIFFNVLFENTTNGDRILQAVREADPDVVVFSEAIALRKEAEVLKAEFPYHVGCERACEVFALSRIEPTNIQLFSLSNRWQQRMAALHFELPDGRGLNVVAAHMLKTWFHDLAGKERAELFVAINRMEGPTVLMGDFNSAPWSFPMFDVYRNAGFAPLRRPVGTWPASAGDLGLPIDHMLVRDGAVLVNLQPFGGDLGSNHRGLLADIAVRRD